MASHTKHKIVLVPFPFDDFSSTKVRPAICLTEPIGKFDHVVIAFISSKIGDEILSTDLLIKKTDDYFSSTGLLVDSILKLHKIVTVPQDLFKRELGFADKTLSKLIEEKILLLFKS